MLKMMNFVGHHQVPWQWMWWPMGPQTVIDVDRNLDDVHRGKTNCTVELL
jgi:hypothetical protein